MSPRPRGFRPDWYKSAFNEDYVRIYASKDATAEGEIHSILRYLELPESANQPCRILDLACGWGRHAVPLARRGYDVTAIDLSRVMLSAATERALAAGLIVQELKARRGRVTVAEQRKPSVEVPGVPPLRLLRADIRSFPFREQFDAVINIFTSFGYFRKESDNLKVLKEVHSALVPGGKFLLDLDNPAYFFRQKLAMGTLKLYRGTSGTEDVLKDETFKHDTGRRVVEYRFIERPPAQRRDIYLECDLYEFSEIKSILEDKIGFQVDSKAWGDFDGTEYNGNTPRLIVLATKGQ